MYLPDLTDDEVDLLAEIEHSRWNVEELLLGYRPVTKEVDAEIDADKSKKSYWRDRFMHYDIRPFSKLKTDSSGRTASEYDKVIVKSLPLIINYKSDENGKN